MSSNPHRRPDEPATAGFLVAVRRLPWEVLAVWALFGLTALAILVTYSRLPPQETYNVSEDGLAGGAGRALVYLNWPVSLVAIAIALFALDRLLETPQRRLAIAATAVSVALGLLITLPGVVDQSDLDAKPINALPPLGVAIALGLSVYAGRPDRKVRLRGDGVRLVLVGVLLLASIPWIAAELGFYIARVPLLGGVFMSDEITPEKDNPLLRAVHLGDHHGFVGALLATAALLLSRVRPLMRSMRLRVAFTAYLALMLAYGLANAVQDGWHEQLVKRGSVDWKMPSVVRPEPSFAWMIVLVLAAAAYVVLSRERLSGPAEPRPS